MGFKVVLGSSGASKEPTALVRQVIHSSSPTIASNLCNATMNATRIIQGASREVYGMRDGRV